MNALSTNELSVTVDHKNSCARVEQLESRQNDTNYLFSIHFLQSDPRMLTEECKVLRVKPV